jgi:hypothetical protein
MCEPVTLGIISTAFGAYSSIQQGNAQAQAAEANAAAAERNANSARWQANQVESKKARELSELNWQKQQTLAKQRVAMAGSGIDSQSGSGMNQLQSTAVLAKKDTDNLEWNAALDKYGYDSQATEFETQASSFRAQASAARTAGTLNAIGGLAMGAYSLSGGSAASKAGSINPDSYAKASIVKPFGLVSPKWMLRNKASTYANYGFGR